MRRTPPRAAPDPDRATGPPWTIVGDVTTIYGWRRVTVRLAGGRRFTLALPGPAVTDQQVRDLIEAVAPTRPSYPMRNIERGNDG